MNKEELKKEVERLKGKATDKRLEDYRQLCLNMPKIWETLLVDTIFYEKALSELEGIEQTEQKFIDAINKVFENMPVAFKLKNGLSIPYNEKDTGVLLTQFKLGLKKELLKSIGEKEK